MVDLDDCDGLKHIRSAGSETTKEVKKEYALPFNAEAAREEGGQSDAGRPAQRGQRVSAGHPARAGRQGRAGLYSRTGAVGVPLSGRGHQRQAHRDHRPADAEKGARGERGGHGAASRRARGHDHVPGRMREGDAEGRRAGACQAGAARESRRRRWRRTASCRRRPSRRLPACSPRRRSAPSGTISSG